MDCSPGENPNNSRTVATDQKKPWPTKAAMSQVYSNGLWGGNGSAFYSGDGSHNPQIFEPYVETVKAFLTSFSRPISVCDLGCGDFNIGQQLAPHAEKYVGVDIVPELIHFNRGKYVYPNVEFKCMDMAKADLPHADCAILRQVLQHLSNSEVKSIVDKLYQFTYIILTEHLPDGDFVPNKDIISGQGIRLKKQSGVDIVAEPFCFNAASRQQLLVQDSGNYGGQLVTLLFRTNSGT